ncbi:MAG: fibro-slime domain-containing protein [Oscillospiraceae bacterium]|nr:fibro-slime domain-containing protein [Oscillospiraceae bacterium]
MYKGYFEQLIKVMERHSLLKKATAALMALVVFVTTYALVLPALTLEKETFCGLEEHVHTEECYLPILICGTEESEGTEDEILTTYETILTCKVSEHEHSEDCFDENGDLTCVLKEHVHGEDCYTEKETTVLIEGQEGHTHSEDCYELVLICDKEEHQHSSDCFAKEQPEINTTVITADGETYQIRLAYTEVSGIPEDAELKVRELTEEDEEYEEYLENAVKETGCEEKGQIYARFFDIEIWSGDTKIEPEGEVSVSILLMDAPKEVESDLTVVHFSEEGVKVMDPVEDAESALLEEKDEDSTELSFVTDSFSVYGVIGSAIEKTVIGSDGHNYSVLVTFTPDSGIPTDAELEVIEVQKDTEEYEKYSDEALEALHYSEASYLRLFDISIVKDGQKIQPADGKSVQVKVQLADADTNTMQVVHFGSTTEVLDAKKGREGDGVEILFETGSFSVYAIVDAPDPFTSTGWIKVSSIDELAERGEQGLYVSHTGLFFFTNGITEITNGRTGITKTNKVVSPEYANGKVLYYFERVPGTTNQFYAYCYSDDGTEKLYVKQTGNSLNFSSEEEKMAFTISTDTTADGTRFRMGGTGGYYWNMQGGESGKSFAAYNSAGDTNSQMYLWYYVAPPQDMYELDGKTFGIMYSDDTILGKAMMSDSEEEGTLVVDELPILSMKDRSKIYVAKDSSISEWTFHFVSDDLYYMTTETDEGTKYLTLTADGVTLEDQPTENAEIKVLPGTGANKGKYNFSVNGVYLNLVNVAGGRKFNASTKLSDTVWLNTVDTKEFTVDDLLIYSAHKVSVSDEDHVYDRTVDGEREQSQVIIYTRVWNDKTLKYEFYAVNHDGSLVRVFESGDVIQWVENSVNTLLWDFTEYHNDDGSPNYFYELQNTQYKKYIAPQVTGSQVLSDSTIGINLNGRRYGYDYTTIVAWDDANYQYVGLKVKDGELVPCRLDEADDFYFAIIKENNDPKALSTVDTIDSTQYGITMKMIDFNNQVVDNRDKIQTEFFGPKDNNVAGMLSTNLTNGYPTTIQGTTGHAVPLSDLFKASDLYEVNHLFIESTYNESGYFEYDSTKNYAYLGDGTDFTVYDQLATVSPSSNAKSTNHGLFFPYTPIINPETGEPWPYSKNYTNTTTTTNTALPKDDPRYGEPLHELPNKSSNYFYGMEVDASFTQTPSGLDAWGHDIIFEFSGDDDFWLYVDGELVLDLGGVHSAMTGTVNFRTGEVKSSRGNSTLYDLFRQNYITRGMSEEEINTKLAEIFQKNEKNQYVFKDYTTHDMRIFYMERGAGSSNLHMRFNLASVKPGTFILKKSLSGVENTSNDLIEFPYQIWYKTEADGEVFEHLLTDNSKVLYEGSSSQVKMMESFTPAGGTEAYQNVFFLKPGQSAEVTLPDGATTYRVVECGINPDIYDVVKANDVVLAGEDTSNVVGTTARQDFATEWDTQQNRSKVEYDNHVKEGAMRSLLITKKVYDSTGRELLTYPIHNDGEEEPTFTFRLYLGNENASSTSLPLANMYAYCVKDPSGNYCKWNSAEQKFESLGKTEYSELSSEEKTLVTFHTSMYGSISKVPVDHTVEVRDLIISSQYLVEERAWEIPRGYTLRNGDGYTRLDVDPVVTGDAARNGTLKVDETPDIEVRNQIGWGLTVQKVWTDKDFMKSHDDIYFAVYLGDDLVEGTVRRLKSSETEVYYFFPDLYDSDGNSHEFSEFVVREVDLTIPEGESLTVDSDGKVTGGYSAVTPIDEGEELIIGGTPSGGTYHSADDGYHYTVSYTTGDPTGHNENVRTDTVTNSRPGIAFYKKTLDGQNLAGAVFKLRDSNDQDVAASSYTSDEDGLITVAYLSEGSYTLTEVGAPKGYVVLDGAMTITLDDNDTVTISGVSSDYYDLEEDPTGQMTAIVTIKNRPSTFLMKKVDGDTAEELEGVHFALYPEVINSADGSRTKDFNPLQGLADLITDENGIIPKINKEQLNPGTYYLTETQTLEGYYLLEGDLCFTIGEDGRILINDADRTNWLSIETTEDGNVAFVVTIPNNHSQQLSIMKVSISDINSPLEGAKFNLYRVKNGVRETLPLYRGMVSGEDGFLVYDSHTVFELEEGVYHLVETEAPIGYEIKTQPVVITVAADRITYDEGTTLSASGDGVSRDETTKVYTIKVSNSAGYALPASGGIGTVNIQKFGLALLGIAGMLMLINKKRKRD